MNANVAIQGESVWKHTPEIVCRQVGGESVLVPIRHNVGNLDFVYTLSEVAAEVWRLIDGTRTIDAIVESICTSYDVDRASAEADVKGLVSDLAEAALLSQVETAG